MQLEKRPVNSGKRDCKNRYVIEIKGGKSLPLVLCVGLKVLQMLMYKGFENRRKPQNFTFTIQTGNFCYNRVW